MKRASLAPPAIHAPAPRQPSLGSIAAKAQAQAPGCQNPNRPALWAFAGSKLRILDVPKTRYRSYEEEAEAKRRAETPATDQPVIMDQAAVAPAPKRKRSR